MNPTPSSGVDLSAASGPTALRRRLAAAASDATPVAAAGCADPFSARLAVEAGFDCVYMTGNGVSAVRLGRPDVGLLTLTEMADQAGRIADAVNVPVVADADTGYGGVLNVARTVAAYERAGVAAFHLEDQRIPKRCGHLEGKEVVPVEEHVARIRAAVAARSNPDTVIIGRTDAVSVDGLAAGIERGRAYGEAGADVVFVEGMATATDVAAVVSELGEWPLAFAWVDGKVDPLTPAELGELGISLVIYPITAVLATMKALQRTYEHLRLHGTSVGLSKDMATFGEYSEFMGASAAAEFEERFAP